MLKRCLLSALTLGAVALAEPAFASFHFMQIEQVIGGVNGDVTKQAIQLRMRTGGQNVVSLSRIRAWDAAGLNPVLLVNLTADVTNGASGSRVLISTDAFNTTFPAAPRNAAMTPIPASYLAAGRITFEGDDGTIYWSLAWGGAGYTGSNAGSTTNDADGNFGPPVNGALPSTGTTALFFTGAATALSTNNLANYATTASAASFTNNNGQTAVVPVELQQFKVE